MISLGEFFNQSDEVITSIKVAIYIFFAYLGIDAGVVEILFVLVCLDTVLGAIKSVRLGHKFCFKVLLWGMVTKLSVLLIPFIIALMAKALSFDFRWFVVAILNLLVVAEGFSAVTNVLSIKTKKNIENVDFISMLLKAIRLGLMALGHKIIETITHGGKK